MLYFEPLSEIPPVEDRYAYDPHKSYLSPMRRLCGGLETGLTLIAARPRMGSSTLAFSLAVLLAKSGAKIAYFAHAQQNLPSIIERHRRSEKEDGTKPFDQLSFYYVEMRNFHTYEDLVPAIVKATTDLHVTCIFVDCLQDIVVDEKCCANQSPEEYLCKNLRDLAYQFYVPIIALTHLNRRPEYRCGLDGKQPQLGDLRGGDLVLYANQIYFPYRPAYYRIHYDEKTGEDIRNQMIVYAMGGIDGLNEEFRLTFDHMGGRVSDGFDEVTPPASAPSSESQDEKNDHIIVDDIPF